MPTDGPRSPSRMSDLREWWAVGVETVLYWLDYLWSRLAYGVAHKWEVRYFIFAMGLVLVVGLFHVWRRKI